uniref:Uncharacterized protein n=1 Tax=Octopus bimaculoides TaxID=37653 RepID=A0A0L8GI77_OCTBM
MHPHLCLDRIMFFLMIRVCGDNRFHQTCLAQICSLFYMTVIPYYDKLTDMERICLIKSCHAYLLELSNICDKFLEKRSTEL